MKPRGVDIKQFQWHKTVFRLYSSQSQFIQFLALPYNCLKGDNVKTDILVYWLRATFPWGFWGIQFWDLLQQWKTCIHMSFLFAFISVSSSSTYVVRKDDSWYFLGWHPPISCRLNPPGPGLLPRSLFQRRCGNILWSGLSLSPVGCSG